MTTIIELFDEEQLENIAAHYFFPDIPLIFFGNEDTMTPERQAHVRRFLALRQCQWQPEFYVINPYRIEDIIIEMEKILSARQDSFVIDITGGKEIELVAMGILAERHQLPIFRLDIRRARLLSVFGVLAPQQKPLAMSLEEMAVLHGGCIASSEDMLFPSTADMQRDVCRLWRLCAHAAGYLGTVTNVFNHFASSTNGLYVRKQGGLSRHQQDMLQQMERLQLIEQLKYARHRLSFRYRDELSKRLLTKTGQCLELFTRLAAEYSGCFDDVGQGVLLGWENELQSYREYTNTKNEADVILQRGLTTIFISCKSGDVKKEALYELDVVAQHFGGTYAKKVLACNRLSGLYNAAESLRARAKEMDITIIENVYELTLDTYAKRLARL